MPKNFFDLYEASLKNEEVINAYSKYHNTRETYLYYDRITKNKYSKIYKNKNITKIDIEIYR